MVTPNRRSSPNLKVGSRAQVMHCTADITSGGLTRSDLMYNKHGRIVSIKKHLSGKRDIQRLFKKGYKPKAGVFRAFRKKSSKANSNANPNQAGGFWW